MRFHVRTLLPRFGLRAFLLAVALCGVGLAWLGNLIRDVHQQRQILEGAFERGYGVTFDDRITHWMYQRVGMNGSLALRAVDYAVMDRRTSAISAEDFKA